MCFLKAVQFCCVLFAMWIGPVAAYSCRRYLEEIHWLVFRQSRRNILSFLEVDEIICQIWDFFFFLRINWTIFQLHAVFEDIRDVVWANSLIRSLYHLLLGSVIYVLFLQHSRFVCHTTLQGDCCSDCICLAVYLIYQ